MISASPNAHATRAGAKNIYLYLLSKRLALPILPVTQLLLSSNNNVVRCLPSNFVPFQHQLFSLMCFVLFFLDGVCEVS